MNETSKAGQALLGDWRITETEVWDREALDLVAEATLTLGAKGQGHASFIAVELDLDYRVVMRDGLPGIEFSFRGIDEGDEVAGRGYAVLKDGQLEGRMFFHQGDDSSFVATRKPNKGPHANESAQPTPRSTRGG
ncbi:MAG: hypothetical protein HY556_02875 [Euryarchaeota archaeon]|nr:hypothetical protein [Euryarchaeota archaeon]